MKYYEISRFPGSAVNPSTLYNTHFKPEISTSYEIGTDFRMFNNRLGIDVTYYQNITKNQIIDSPIDVSSGYTSAIVNAGKVRNRGVEVTFNATPVMTKISSGILPSLGRKTKTVFWNSLKEPMTIKL